MFLRSFASFLTDSLKVIPSSKYKVLFTNKDVNDIKVHCEVIETGDKINFSLNEIVSKNKLQYFSSMDVLEMSKLILHKNNTASTIKNTMADKYYYAMSLIFIISLITANLAAIKVCTIFGYTLPGGTIIFPLLYVLNDILTEVYGFSASRKVIWLALLCNLFIVLMLYAVTLIPPSEHWPHQDAFATIFNLSPRIFVASITSYFLGELVNAFIISMLKLRLKGKYFILRAMISTAIGAFLESILFCTIAFSNIMQYKQLVSIAITLTAIKFFYELFIIPITAKIVVFIKCTAGIDVFEKPSLKQAILFSKS